MENSFAPLTQNEVQQSTTTLSNKLEVIAIVPVPENTAYPDFNHFKHDKPTDVYYYRNEQWQLLFIICRYDFINGDGVNDKCFTPFTYCKDTAGMKCWQKKLLLHPRPLYGLEALSQKPTALVVVVEGEKAANAARKLLTDCAVITSSGGSRSASKSDWKPVELRDVIIWRDADDAGKEYADDVAKLCEVAGALSVNILDIPADKPDGWDAADALSEGWAEEVARRFIGSANVDNHNSSLKVVNIREFLEMELAPKEMILHPIIPKQGVVMVYAFRGIGKTYIALGIAYAVATGSQFLKWHAPVPRRVLYIDGEMPARTMQERLSHEVTRCSVEPPSQDYFRIITPDFQERGIPSLSDPAGQAEINKHLQGVELVIIDNISTLCRGGRENESESWSPVQEWALDLRKRGISVLFIHHAGKNNQQRGASKKEDIMDTVISLKRPEDYESAQGARFEVHYEKARGIIGEDARAFEAWLKTEGDSSMWQVSELEDTELAEVILLHEQGHKQREIAQKVGFSAAKVNRLLKKANEGK